MHLPKFQTQFQTYRTIEGWGDLTASQGDRRLISEFDLKLSVEIRILTILALFIVVTEIAFSLGSLRINNRFFVLSFLNFGFIHNILINLGRKHEEWSIEP